MDTFDSHYSVKMSELIFPEYNKNKFIDGHMYCVLDGDKKYNIILGINFNV